MEKTGLDRKKGVEKEKLELEESLAAGIETESIKTAAVELFALAKRLNEYARLYDSIISDDAGGRLVSLFLRKVINAKRGAGLKPIEIRFIAGGRGMGEERRTNIKEFLRKNQKILGKALLVSEYIETGKSLINLGRVLESAGVDFDIAILSSLLAHNIDEVESKIPGHRIFVGAFPSNKGHALYKEDNEIGGIEKRGESASPFPELFNTPERFPERVFDKETGKWVTGQEAKKILREKKKQAREDIKLLAEKVSSLINQG